MNNKIKIFDVGIDNISLKEAKNILENILIQKKQIKIFTPNPEILLKAEKYSEFKKILQDGDLLVPDGIGIILMSRIFGDKFKEKITGVDLMMEICAMAEKHQKSIFFLGGRNKSAEKTSNILKSIFSKLIISGFSEDVDSCYNLIKDSTPNIIFVALGAPKQEVWISKNIKNFPFINIAIGVGGAFDLISGKIKRAPLMIQRVNMEWLWRLLMEPRRILRIFNAIIIFPLKVIFYKLK
ncbi:MAG: WecB/TagA/CpsF family glycosyltransferase [Patescibacteria group bacterium]